MNFAWLRRALVYGVLLLAALAVLLPYLWMLSASLKPEEEIFTREIQLIPRTVNWDNYLQVWEKYPLARWLLNSIVVAAAETLSIVVTSVLAGYAFARLRFWGRDVLFYMFLGTIMIPAQVTLIPSFLIIKQFGWINTYQGLIMPHVAAAFGVFLMRQFFLSFPSELEDAARIDGCGWGRILVQIVLPLTLPAVSSLAIIAFTFSWNNFLWPLVVINSKEMLTIQLGLASLKGEVIAWGLLMAATMISALPILVVYLSFQRYFVKGIAMTGLKG
ncbi:MAG: carbohydrate ABC transporter permease [Chloroflexi bacterium]|nr:carbohydrate ABC transporter permease [Chloroflexota bacterium]